MRASSPTIVPMKIDKKEWSEELVRCFNEERGEPDPGWKSVSDLAEVVDCGNERVRIAIKRLTKEGRIQTKQGRRMAIDGLMRWTTLYHIKDKEASK